MKLNTIFFLIMLGLIFVACDDEEMPMGMECETAGLTYTDDIASIINSTCALSGCHEMNSSTTFEMHDFATITAAVGFGRIIGAINQDAGFSPMPRGGEKLEDCTIDMITAWINDGAPE
jgi:hypothetical protein